MFVTPHRAATLCFRRIGVEGGATKRRECGVNRAADGASGGAFAPRRSAFGQEPALCGSAATGPRRQRPYYSHGRNEENTGGGRARLGRRHGGTVRGIG